MASLTCTCAAGVVVLAGAGLVAAEPAVEPVGVPLAPVTVTPCGDLPCVLAFAQPLSARPATLSKQHAIVADERAEPKTRKRKAELNIAAG